MTDFSGIIIENDNCLYIIGEVTAVDVRPGDILEMKKNHPCGEKRFLVTRSGMDFRIRCVKCGREVLVARAKIEKNIKKIIREPEQ